MPQFQIPLGSFEDGRTFARLSKFTQGYIEAMFFTDTGSSDDAENGLEEASFAELAPEILTSIIAECEAFQRENAALLDEAYEHGGDPRTAAKWGPYDETRAGADFWFSRNGHGVGFWDRGIPTGHELSEACGWRTPFPERNVYRGDDGKVYTD